MLKSPEHLLSNDDQRLLPLSFPSPQASKQHENPKQPLEGRRREDVAISLWVGLKAIAGVPNQAHPSGLLLFQNLN